MNHLYPPKPDKSNKQEVSQFWPCVLIIVCLAAAALIPV